MNGRADAQWFTDFMKLNNKFISLQQPQANSLAGATTFNISVVEIFFQKRISVLEKHNFGPEHITF
jgi:hypothetical protein